MGGRLETHGAAATGIILCQRPSTKSILLVMGFEPWAAGLK